MKLWLLVCGVLPGMMFAVLGEEPDDQYIRLYRQLEQADQLVERGQTNEARIEFSTVRDALAQIQTNHPAWNPQIIDFRLRYVTDRLKMLPAPAEVPPPSELDQLRQRNRELEVDRDLLQAKLREALGARPAAVDPRALAQAEERIKAQQKEIEVLKVQLQKTEAAPESPVKRVQMEADQQSLTVARQQVVTLETQNTSLRIELADAQRQLARSQASTTNTPAPGIDPDRVRVLERERDDLRLQLDGAKRELLAIRMTNSPGGANDIAALQSRIEALEARRLPYTVEELALFKTPAQETNATPTSAPAPSAEIATLLQRAKEQIERREFREADKTLLGALEVAPRDASCLSLSGQVKFQLLQLDAPLDTLSQASQLDPQDASTFHYLGLTMSRKGLREPAEAALWRAVQLDPRNAVAHYNLAVLFAAKRPPVPELARFHYQKSVEAGLAKNPAFEKQLASLPAR